MSEKLRRQPVLRVICLYIVFLLPQTANGDRRPNDGRQAMIEVILPPNTTRPPCDRPQQPTVENSSAVGKTLQGVFAKAGSMQSSGGVLINFSACEGGDEEFLETKPNEDWIALLYYPPPCHSNDTTDNISECLRVLDRVKNAVLFGASAIIILTMNPNIFQELDIAQLFSQPIVMVRDIGNITVLLEILRSGLDLKLKVKVGPCFCNAQTFTVWSACWRARPGSGVVCMSDSRLSKANPSLFWSYFYSALAVIMLLLLIKTNRRRFEGAEDEMEQETVVVAEWQALSCMKIERYRKSVRKYDDSERDTCAICLDQFYNKQKIRILPCIHQFHTKCVDPWLVRHPTCPLCNLQVLETKHVGKLFQNFGW